MSISYQFGDVDAHGAMIRSQAASLEAEPQLGRNFQTIYEQANSHGQKVQSAGNNMNSTDSAVGSSWA
jgi:hypothetical protein